MVRQHPSLPQPSAVLLRGGQERAEDSVSFTGFLLYISPPKRGNYSKQAAEMTTKRPGIQEWLDLVTDPWTLGALSVHACAPQKTIPALYCLTGFQLVPT